MAISASGVTHAIQTMTHRHSDHPSAPMQRREAFQQQLAKAAAQGQRPGETPVGASSGGLLSADLLKAVQTLR